MTATATSPVTVRLNHIDFHRVEGYAEECVPRTFYAWAPLHAHVRSAARTAPTSGGFDKCAVKVKWEDGTSFKFRFDLTNAHVLGVRPVADQMRRELMFFSGRACPAHLTDETYKTLLQGQERVQPGITQWIGQIIDGGYDLGAR